MVIDGDPMDSIFCPRRRTTSHIISDFVARASNGAVPQMHGAAASGSSVSPAFISALQAALTA